MFHYFTIDKIDMLSSINHVVNMLPNNKAFNPIIAHKPLIWNKITYRKKGEHIRIMRVKLKPNVSSSAKIKM